MIAQRSPKTEASTPNPRPKSGSASPGPLERAADVFERGLEARGLHFSDRSQRRTWRSEAWAKAGFPGLHLEKAAAMFDTRGAWRDELERLIEHVERLESMVHEPDPNTRKRRPRIADRVDAGVLFALVGGRGGGKTQLATCLAAFMATLGRSTRYTTAQRLFRDIRAAFDDRKVSEQDVIDRFTRPDLLVIDEAHDRAASDFEARTLNAITDERYHAGRLTLFISNETARRFAESVGATITSRFEEAGEVITVSWPSFRAGK